MRKCFYYLVMQIAVVAAIAVPAIAQGGTGRSETVPPITVPETGSRTSSKRASHRPARSYSPEPRDVAPETGRLALIVNEGNSSIELARADGSGVPENIPVSAKSLILRDLVVGRYSLTARKEGFQDEVRTVEITKGKRRRVELNLRPKMAVLSVSASVEGATIQIANVGEFDKPVSGLMLKPGVYQIEVKRLGYKTRHESVTLKKPGSSEYLKIILEPLSIDSMLEQANENIKKGNLAEAEDLIKDVLQLNPLHARANLTYGMIQYERGDKDAVSYFIKAIQRGETLRLPVEVLYGAPGRRLVEAELALSRDDIKIKSNSVADLNFSIERRGITQLDRGDGEVGVPFVLLAGKSDFHGRPIEPKLTLVSTKASMPSGASALSCEPTNTARSCASDTDILFQLLTAWREAAEH